MLDLVPKRTVQDEERGGPCGPLEVLRPDQAPLGIAIVGREALSAASIVLTTRLAGEMQILAGNTMYSGLPALARHTCAGTGRGLEVKPRRGPFRARTAIGSPLASGLRDEAGKRGMVLSLRWRADGL